MTTVPRQNGTRKWTAANLERSWQETEKPGKKPEKTERDVQKHERGKDQGGLASLTFVWVPQLGSSLTVSLVFIITNNNFGNYYQIILRKA
jgi:hypothetical protein